MQYENNGFQMRFRYTEFFLLNRFRFDRITAMSLWPTFLAHPVYDCRMECTLAPAGDYGELIRVCSELSLLLNFCPGDKFFAWNSGSAELGDFCPACPPCCYATSGASSGYQHCSDLFTITHTHPFVRDYPGEPVPERYNQSGFY